MGKKAKREDWEKLFYTDKWVLSTVVTFHPTRIIPYWSLFVVYGQSDGPAGMIMLPFPKTGKGLRKMFNKLSVAISYNRLMIDEEFKQKYAIDDPGIGFVADFGMTSETHFTPGHGDDVDVIHEALFDEFSYWANFWHSRDQRYNELCKQMIQDHAGESDFDFIETLDRVREIIDVEYPMPYASYKE